MEIARLRSRLAAIEAAGPARHCRVAARIAARQVELTDEVAGMVTFFRASPPRSRPLRGDRRLSSVLAGTSTTGVSAPVADAAKAAALRVFADETRSIAARSNDCTSRRLAGHADTPARLARGNDPEC